MHGQKHLIYLRIITTTLLIVGGLTWGITGAIGFNPVSRTLRALNLGFLSQAVYLMIGISALIYLYFFYNSNTFLPFLSEATFPTTMINLNQTKNYDHEITLTHAPPNATSVVYWAAEPHPNATTYNPTSPLASQNKDHRAPYPNPKKAYKDYENAGSTQVENGKAILRLKKPPAYILPNGKINQSHIHYRWVLKPGMLSEVYTLYL